MGAFHRAHQAVYFDDLVRLGISTDWGLVMALAAWLRYLHGKDYAGEPINVEDVRADQLQPLAERAMSEPYAILAQEEVFGMIAQCEGLVEALEEAFDLLEFGPLEAAVAVTDSGSVAPAGAAA